MQGNGYVNVPDSASIDSITDSGHGRCLDVSDGPVTSGSYATAISRQIGTGFGQHYHLSVNDQNQAILFITTTTAGQQVIGEPADVPAANLGPSRRDLRRQPDPPLRQRGRSEQPSGHRALRRAKPTRSFSPATATAAPLSFRSSSPASSTRSCCTDGRWARTRSPSWRVGRCCRRGRFIRTADRERRRPIAKAPGFTAGSSLARAPVPLSGLTGCSPAPGPAGAASRRQKRPLRSMSPASQRRRRAPHRRGRGGTASS